MGGVTIHEPVLGFGLVGLVQVLNLLGNSAAALNRGRKVVGVLLW